MQYILFVYIALVFATCIQQREWDMRLKFSESGIIEWPFQLQLCGNALFGLTSMQVIITWILA